MASDECHPRFFCMAMRCIASFAASAAHAASPCPDPQLAIQRMRSSWLNPGSNLIRIAAYGADSRGRLLIEMSITALETDRHAEQNSPYGHLGRFMAEIRYILMS